MQSALLIAQHVIDESNWLCSRFHRQAADRGISLEAQAEKIRAMAVVHNAELLDIIVDGGEPAKSLYRPGIR